MVCETCVFELVSCIVGRLANIVTLEADWVRCRVLPGGDPARSTTWDNDRVLSPEGHGEESFCILNAGLGDCCCRFSACEQYRTRGRPSMIETSTRCLHYRERTDIRGLLYVTVVSASAITQLSAKAADLA